MEVRKRYSAVISIIILIISLAMFYHAEGYLDRYLIAALIEFGIAIIIFVYAIFLFEKNIIYNKGQ
jgi:energy-converting hydrogenase Eha subunit C